MSSWNVADKPYVAGAGSSWDSNDIPLDHHEALDPRAQNLMMGVREARRRGSVPGEYVTERLPFVGGGYTVEKNKLTIDAAKRIKDGKASFPDYVLVGKHIVDSENERKKGFGEKVWDIVTHVPGFVAEFSATGGAYSGVKTAVSGTVRGAIGRAGSKAAQSLSGRIASGTAGVTAGIAAQAAISPQLVMSEASRRMIPEFDLKKTDQNRIKLILRREGDGFMEAVGKGYLNAVIELGSERAGAAIPYAGKSLMSRFPRSAGWIGAKANVIQRWLRLNPGKGVGGFSKKLAEKAGWNGILGEIFEERVGDIARGATGLTPDYGTTGKLLSGDSQGFQQLGVEATAFSVFPAGRIAAERLAALADTKWNRRDFAEAKGIPVDQTPSRKSMREEIERARRQLAEQGVVTPAVQPQGEFPTIPQTAGPPLPPSNWQAPEQRQPESGQAEAGQTSPSPQTASPGGWLGGMGTAISDNFYKGVEESILKTGEVPAAEKNSLVGQLWNFAKDKMPARDFVQALRDGAAENATTASEWANGIVRRETARADTPQPGPQQQQQPEPQRRPIGQLTARHPQLQQLFDADAGVKEGVTVGEHTRVVLENLDTSELADLSKSTGLNLDRLLPVTVALHDIGKSLAVQSGNRRRQHEFTIPILRDVLQKHGFDAKHIAFATSLVDHDILGDLLKGHIAPKSAADQLKRQAKAAGVSLQDFAKVAKVFYKADIAAYPSLRKKLLNDGRLHSTDFGILEEKIHGEAIDNPWAGILRRNLESARSDGADRGSGYIHATGRKFDAFEEKYDSGRNRVGPGVYLLTAEDADIAKEYAKRAFQRVAKLFSSKLRIRLKNASAAEIDRFLDKVRNHKTASTEKKAEAVEVLEALKQGIVGEHVIEVDVSVDNPLDLGADESGGRLLSHGEFNAIKAAAIHAHPKQADAIRKLTNRRGLRFYDGMAKLLGSHAAMNKAIASAGYDSIGFIHKRHPISGGRAYPVLVVLSYESARPKPAATPVVQSAATEPAPTSQGTTRPADDSPEPVAYGTADYPARLKNSKRAVAGFKVGDQIPDLGKMVGVGKRGSKWFALVETEDGKQRFFRESDIRESKPQTQSDDYDTLTVSQLRTKLKSRELQSSGPKSILINRLRNHDRQMRNAPGFQLSREPEPPAPRKAENVPTSTKTLPGMLPEPKQASLPGQREMFDPEESIGGDQRQSWRAVVDQYAKDRELDIEPFRAAVEESHRFALEQWQAEEPLREFKRKHPGLSRKAQGAADMNSVKGFDTMADEWIAEQGAGLGIHDAQDLWDRVKEPNAPRPTRSSVDVLKLAESIYARGAGQSTPLGDTSFDTSEWLDSAAPSVSQPLSVSMEPGGPRISNHEIIAAMEHEFDVPIRIGRVPGAPLGIYQRKPELVRLKSRFGGDLGVATHEVTHHVDRTVGMRKGIPPLAGMELADLDYDPKKRRTSEGVAEFMRLYLTHDDAAEQHAPTYHKWFVETWAKDNPELFAKFQKIQDQISRWRNQGAGERIKANISQTGKPARPADVPRMEWLRDKLTGFGHRAYAALKDEGHFLNLFSKELKEKGHTAEPGESPFEVYQAFTQSGPTFAHSAIENGVFSLSTMDRTGPSLQDVFREIDPAEYQTFVSWLYARHAREAAGKGQATGITRADAEYWYNQHKSDRYEQAAERFTEFNNALIDMLADSGVIAHSSAEKIKDAYETYIPLMRVRDSVKRKGGNARKLLDVPDPLKRRKGADLQIIDPIQATVERAVRFYERAAQQQVIERAISAAEKTKGMGGWIVRVAPGTTKTSFPLQEIWPTIAEKLELAGIEPEMLEDVDTADLLSIYRPDYFYRGDQPIARVIRNGNPALYEFDKDLFMAINGMNYFQMPHFLELTFGAATRVVKLGATGLNLAFGAKNAIRDYGTYVMQKKHAGDNLKGLVAPIDMIRTYIASEAMKLAGKESDPVVRLWQQMGGELAQTLGLDRKRIRTTVKRVVNNTTATRALNIVKYPIESLRAAIGISEVGPRLAEFRAVLESHGYDRERLKNDVPPRKVLIEAINAANDVTVNFKRQGWVGKWINRHVPFFNAALEGSDKFIRAWRDNPKRTFIASAFMASAAVAYWYRVKDEDWYDEAPDWQKYGFWTLADENGAPAVRIPRPQSWGVTIASGTEAILNQVEKKDPNAIRDYAKYAGDSLSPNMKPALLTPAVEAYFNWDTFRNKPIVPEQLARKKPKDQHTAYNTMLSRKMGEYVGVSPAKLEHFLTAQTGGLYRNTMKPAETILYGSEFSEADIPGVGGFTFRRDYARSVEEFYKKLHKAEQEYASAKKTGTVPDDLKRLQEYAKAMTKIRDGANKIADRQERFEREKYIIGLARFALGKPELDRYPNPLPDRSAPQRIIDAVRSEKAIASRAATLARLPKRRLDVDDHERRKKMGLTVPDYRRWYNAELELQQDKARQWLAFRGLGLADLRKAYRTRDSNNWVRIRHQLKKSVKMAP